LYTKVQAWGEGKPPSIGSASTNSCRKLRANLLRKNTDIN